MGQRKAEWVQLGSLWAWAHGTLCAGPLACDLGDPALQRGQEGSPQNAEAKNGSLATVGTREYLLPGLKAGLVGGRWCWPSPARIAALCSPSRMGK